MCRSHPNEWIEPIDGASGLYERLNPEVASTNVRQFVKEDAAATLRVPFERGGRQQHPRPHEPRNDRARMLSKNSHIDSPFDPKLFTECVHLEAPLARRRPRAARSPGGENPTRDKPDSDENRTGEPEE